MRKTLFTLVSSIAIMFYAADSALAASSSAKVKKQQKAVTAAIIISGTLRSLGLQGKFVSALTPVQESKWLNDFKQLYSNGKSPLVTDFFRGAVTLLGPQNDSKGIIGYYDPWSDNILLLAIDYKDTLKIMEYRFLSGRFFRTGKVTPVQISQTVNPTVMPLEVALLEGVSGTRKKFTSVFPVNMKEITLAAVPLTTDKTLEEIKMNAAVRLNRAISLLQSNNKELLAKLLICNALVQKSPMDGFEKLFEKSSASMKMAKAVTTIPPEIRKGFKICYYLPMKNSISFSYLNPTNPAVVITITIPNNPKQRYSMTFMDLSMADNLLSVLSPKSGKGGRK